MTASTGKQGCPCTDVSSILSSLTERHCTTPDGQLGILLSPSSESCVPYSYGSSNCLQHDLIHDPACDLTKVNVTNIPAYCISPWCYVDMETCARDSEERVIRTEYFGEADVFYSYATCNSTYEWSEFDSDSKQVLGGISIKAAIPTYLVPMLYKMSDGEILASPGDEYYNNSIPYAGVYVNYVNDILRIASGDIQNIVYTHRSRSSDTLHPTSAYTAAVKDIEDGLVDMAMGPFWITPQRLQMTSFTVPIVYDKTVLVIPKPGENNSILHQTSKVLEPFTPGLWGLVIAIIIFTALLSVWFSEKPKMKASRRDSLEQVKTRKRSRQSVAAQKQHFRRRRDVYARKFLDAILEKGIFFFSAGVDQDERASLPHKLLMFGFSFFILISVSAYVANLAAFLTRAVPNNVGTMEGVVEYGLKICGHPALQEDLEKTWPEANFVFNNTGKEIYGQLSDYHAGKCDVMAVSLEDATMDLELMNAFCKHDLVFTDELVIENPVAFPIKPELAAGFSYWMYQGEKFHDVSIKRSKVSYNELNNRVTNCNVKLSEQDEEESDYARISPLNMSFPIMFWGMFSIIAVILQIVRMWKSKKGKGSVILGTTSSFDVFARSYRTAKKSLLGRKDEEDDNNDIISSNLVVRPSKLEDTSQDDCENQLPESIIEPIPVLQKPDESENDRFDHFDENGHACTSANSEVPILKSSTGPPERMNVSFSLEHEASFTGSDHDGSDLNCSEKEDDIKCRIDRLMETSAVAELFECFHEMKKLKDK